MTEKLVLTDLNPQFAVEGVEPETLTLEVAPVLKGDKGDKGDTVTPAEVVATLPVIDVFGVDGQRICTLYGDLAA